MSESELTILGDAAPLVLTELVRIALHAADDDVRIRAGNSVLDRYYGKPAQTIMGDDKAPVSVSIDLINTVAHIAHLAKLGK